MNIKQAILELQKLERQHMDATANGDAIKEERCDGMIGRIQEACNLWADMAEAAIAHAEFQISSHSRNGDDAPMNGATYIRERGKLWDAFMEARARAKAANQW